MQYYDGSVEDITDLRNMQSTLERAERDYRILFDANPHPMYIFDSATLRFLAVNDAAVAKYGYGRSELLARTILEIRPDGETARLMDYLDRADEQLATSGPWIHR